MRAHVPGSACWCAWLGAQRAGFSSNDFRRWLDHRLTVVRYFVLAPKGRRRRRGCSAVRRTRAQASMCWDGDDLHGATMVADTVLVVHLRTWG